jgi:acetyltransferase-like isoleucine patch superfamily enzyme
LSAIVDARFPAYLLRRTVEALRWTLHDYRRTVEPGVDRVTAEIVSRDHVIAPSLKNIFLGEGTFFGPRSRILIQANRPGDPPGRVETGRNVRLGSGTYIEVFTDQTVTIGEATTLGEGCAVAGDVTIGRHCLLAWNLYIVTGDHHVGDVPGWLIRDQDARSFEDPKWSSKFSRRIVVDDDVWIGWGAFVKQGVHIGRGAVIGAYTIVTRDVPPYSIQGGAPNRELGRRLRFTPPALVDAALDEHRPYFYSGFRHRQADRPASRRGIFADGPCRIVASGGRFDRLVVRARQVSRPVTLGVSLNGVALGEVTIGLDGVPHVLSIPESASRASREGLLRGHSVVDFEPRSANDSSPQGAPIVELSSVSLE